MTERDEFLRRCKPQTEVDAFRAVFEGIERVRAAHPTRLQWRLENRALILDLLSARLPGGSTPLLFFWPSDSKQVALPDSISTQQETLSKAFKSAGLSPTVLDQFGEHLQAAGFKREESEGWRTETYDQRDRADRMSSIFTQGGWGAKNVDRLSSAVADVLTQIANMA